MKSKHLTETVLADLAGNWLSGDDSQAAKKHLAECAACREKYSEFQFARAVLGRMAEVGYQEALAAPVSESPKPQRGEFAFPWGPVITISLGCICVMVFLFYPRFTPTVSAAELLSNAMQYEDRGGDAKAFRVQVSGQTCADGQRSEKMVSFDSSVRCGRALQHIQNTPWGHGNPLSAKTYATWRSSLHRRHDRVAKLENSWQIQTTTDEGAVHIASLELRAKDYHATKLTLDFADNEEVSISEETEPLPNAPAPLAADVTTKNVPPTPVHIDNPSDLLEVEAWKIIHQLHADSGWEAIVLRNGPEVRVKAIVKDDARKQELEKGFAAYPNIALDIHLSTDPVDTSDIFPDRVRLTADTPALAADWLKQQFADVDARTKFSNRALLASQQVLGRAFIVDTLQQRRVSLVHCSCEKDLSSLIDIEKLALSNLEASLSVDLEPMLGSLPASSPRALTLANARLLDASLEELLVGGSDASQLTFEAQVEAVRGMLSQN